MRSQPLALLALATAISFVACTPPIDDGTSSSSSSSSTSGGSSSSSSSSSGASYTDAQLESARKALPRLDVMTAHSPQSPSNPSPQLPPTIGETADYPQIANPIVQGINAQVAGIVNALHTLSQHDPSAYNSETREFFWGPFPDTDSPLSDDTVSAYVREHQTGDFRFTYALIRGKGNDTSTFSPVIWGGANPNVDNPDYGSGVTLWDFEANRAWLDAQYPDHGAAPGGRFVALYLHGQDTAEPAKIVTAVFASFWNATFPDHPDDAPVNFDHLYGHVNDTSSSSTFDFVDIEAKTDLDHADGGQTEELSLRLAFYNSGLGRGEAIGTGGDIGADEYRGVECWNALIERQYYNVTAHVADADGGVSVEAEGELANCGDTFSNSLDALGVPSIDDIDQALLDALRSAAQNGIQH